MNGACPTGTNTDRADSSSVDRAAYPFQRRWVGLPAGRLHYVEEGSGEPLLLVHGTPTWSFEWRHIIRALAPAWRCVAPDHLGFGLSDRPREFPYTPEAHAENLRRFVEVLALDQLTLVVHDYGGPIGLPLCLQRPTRVKRLVVLNTWMWSFEGDREMQRKARVAGGRVGRFLYRWANFSLRILMPYAYGDRRKLTAAIHRQYLDRFPDRWSRGTVLWALARAMLNSSAYYDSLWSQRDGLRGRPALILWGMRDPAFQPHLLARWREVLPEARVVELADVGHWPQEEAPERVVQEIRSLLAT